MRIVPALAALVTIAATSPQPARIGLTWQPVPLDAAQPDRRSVGSLRYIAGWTLFSRDPRFGGISAMRVEGRRVSAISDTGAVIRFDLGASQAEFLELPAGPGAVAGKKNGDSESLVVAGDRAWIGFERANGIWSYSWPDLAPRGSAKPAAMRRWPVNGGAEAMLRLADGRFLVFSEEQKRPDGSTEVLLFGGDPIGGGAPLHLGYRAPKGYVVTDATQLPDGRLLILNRRYVALEGVSAKLVIAEAPLSRQGAVIAGREIADFHAPLTVDNYEALSVTREQGRTIVWIASDDNFSAVQRTLLLELELKG